MPVLKWTICSKVYKTRAVLSHKAALSFMQYLSVIRQYLYFLWKGYVCCCFVIKHKKGTNVILSCHTKMQFCHSLPLVCRDLGFGRLRTWTLKILWEKLLKKISRIHCAKRHAKTELKTMDLIVFYHGTMKFFNEDIWSLLLNYSFYFGWKGEAKGRRLLFCLLKNRPKA